MNFPDIDPIAFSIGGFAVHWYGIAYFVGIVLGAALARRYARRWPDFGLTPGAIEDFTF